MKSNEAPKAMKIICEKEITSKPVTCLLRCSLIIENYMLMIRTLFVTLASMMKVMFYVSRVESISFNGNVQIRGIASLLSSFLTHN